MGGSLRADRELWNTERLELVLEMTGAIDLTSVETDRLRLSPFSPADEEILIAMFRDDHVRRYLLDGALVDRVWVRAEIEASAGRFAAGSLGLFLARSRDAGEVIGFAGFRPDHEPPVLEVMYALLPAFWGLGLATEMARVMLDLAFNAHGLEVVRAAVDVPNQASIRVLERLGMTIERRSPGAFGVMLHYALARADWK